MSMYNVVERDGKTIVVDHFTRQPVSDVEEFGVIVALFPEKPSTEQVEETESSKKQDKQA